jgi:hypothetical protein
MQHIILAFQLNCNVLGISIDCHVPDSAIAQAVSRRLPTATARVRVRVRSCGIFGRQSSFGTGFLRAFRFPLPILILPTSSHSSSIIRGWYNGPNTGRRAKWVQSHPIRTAIGLQFWVEFYAVIVIWNRLVRCKGTNTL